jgi:hypothetical protein
MSEVHSTVSASNHAVWLVVTLALLLHRLANMFAQVSLYKNVESLLLTIAMPVAYRLIYWTVPIQRFLQC